MLDYKGSALLFHYLPFLHPNLLFVFFFFFKLLMDVTCTAVMLSGCLGLFMDQTLFSGQNLARSCAGHQLSSFLEPLPKPLCLLILFIRASVAPS